MPRFTYRTAANQARADRNALFEERILDRIDGEGLRAVCDVGGGPNPLLGPEAVAARDLRYVLLDPLAEQLDKAPPGYETAHADAAAPPPELRGAFDLVLSQWVAEHVEDPPAFHAGIRALLRPGGYAVHLFPTLYAIPFVANLLLPERVAGALAGARALTPGPTREPEGRHGKFPAHYRWCRGPSARQVRRLEGAGFEVLEYVGFFGHGYYQRLGPLARAEARLADFLVRHPVAQLTSAAVVVLRRPR
jgi:SAM-dependent methyltransferase